MADRALAYELGRAHLTELLNEGDPAAADEVVPACPAWTVRDLVAHLQHVAEEYSAGRFPYRSLDPNDMEARRAPDRVAINDMWADAGVDARRDRSLGDLLHDWELSAQRLYRMMTDEPVLADATENDYLAWSAFGDFAVHYQDVLGALDLPADRDAYCAKLGFGTLPVLWSAHVRSLDRVPPLRLVTQRGDLVVGTGGDSPATLEVDWFELYRAMSGRRSRGQVVALLEPVGPDRYLDAFTLYPFAEKPLAV
jgi:uncharacterized protein (TIGR03083 family)